MVRARAVAAGLAALGAVALATTAGASTGAEQPRHAGASPHAVYPVGIVDAQEPSGVAPPPADALRGYVRSYVTDFTGSTLPTGWSKFAGTPNGDPNAFWGLGHVVVSGGMARLITNRHGSKWVSGGMCLCAQPMTYGAIFVRSRVTGPGPDEAEMLWPKANVWPPEVDFNEADYHITATSWDAHYGKSNAFEQGEVKVNLRQWHTFGVIWTRTSLVFTLDGVVWGETTRRAVVPHQAMTLDIDQQAWCNGTKWASCPRGAAALQVDWVVEYHPG